MGFGKFGGGVVGNGGLCGCLLDKGAGDGVC